jgi:hypothetical protein
MDILTNNICKLQILSKSHLLFNDDSTPKNPNIASGVFFKRDAYYKNFGIYVSGLARTVKFIDSYNAEVDEIMKIPEGERTHSPEKFVFLLFIDQNIRDDRKIMSIIGSSKSTVPVLFTCPVYMKGNYHIDLFGTLVRFFPMFNFPNNPALKSTVISIDIELNREDCRKVTALMRHRPEGVTASGEIHNLIYKGEIPYIFSGTLCFNRERLDSELITKFIESAHTIVGTGHYGKRQTTFGYGIDEMFLNSHLIPTVKNYSIIIEYQISYFLYHSQPYIKKQKRENISHQMLKMILYDLFSPELSVTDMLNIIANVQHVSDIKKMVSNKTRELTTITPVSKTDSKDGKFPIKTVDSDTDLESEAVFDLDKMDAKRDSAKIQYKDSVMHKILHKLLGDMYDPNSTVEKLLTIVDEKTYNVRDKNVINNALAERFYYIIHDLVTNDKTWLEIDVMRLIDKYLRNIVSAYVIFEIDPDNKKVVNIETLDTVYTDNII